MRNSGLPFPLVADSGVLLVSLLGTGNFIIFSQAKERSPQVLGSWLACSGQFAWRHVLFYTGLKSKSAADCKPFIYYAYRSLRVTQNLAQPV